jgi:hypothetical protein
MIAGASHSIPPIYARCALGAIVACERRNFHALITAPHRVVGQTSRGGAISQTSQSDVLAHTRRSVAEASDRLLGSPFRNLAFGVIYMLVVMAAAVGAYVGAGWSLGDAVYMVIVTVYTVGYGEVRPVDTPLLRGITISTITLGCTGMIYLTGALVQFITLN